MENVLGSTEMAIQMQTPTAIFSPSGAPYIFDSADITGKFIIELLARALRPSTILRGANDVYRLIL